MAFPEPSFFEALDETSLAEKNTQVLEIQGQKIALVKSNGKIYALENTCPHLGGSLGKGTVKNNCLICPLHHWTFDLSTGRCVEGVADEKVRTFEAKTENGKILLKWP